MKRTEVSLFILSLVMIIAKLLTDFPGSSVMLLFLLMGTSFFYLCFSFMVFNKIRLRNIFGKSEPINITALRTIGSIATGFSISILLTGILFKLLHWKGGDVIILAGITSGLLISVTVLVSMIFSASWFSQHVFSRIAVYTLIAVVLFYTPGMYWIRVAYHSNPQVIEAYEHLYAHPEDPDAWEKIEDAKGNR